jgi:hypothetical protein
MTLFTVIAEFEGDLIREMIESEVYTALQSNRSKRRWAKVRAARGSVDCPANATKTVPVVPRMAFSAK